MDWRCRFDICLAKSIHAICPPRRGRGDLSPRPPLLKERGRVGDMDWRYQLRPIGHAIVVGNDGEATSPPDPLS